MYIIFLINHFKVLGQWHLVHLQCCVTTTSNKFPKHFHHLQRETHTMKRHSSSATPLPPPSLQPPIHFLSLWIYLFETDRINGIMQTVDFLCLASFTELHVFRAHPHRRVCHSPLWLSNISSYGFPPLVYPSFIDGWWTLGMFPPLAIVFLFF